MRRRASGDASRAVVRRAACRCVPPSMRLRARERADFGHQTEFWHKKAGFLVLRRRRPRQKTRSRFSDACPRGPIRARTRFRGQNRATFAHAPLPAACCAAPRNATPIPRHTRPPPHAAPPHAAAHHAMPRRNWHAAQNAASTGSLTRTRSWPRSSSVSFASSGAWVPSSIRNLSVTSSANPVSSTFAPQSAAMRVNCS